MADTEKTAMQVPVKDLGVEHGKNVVSRLGFFLKVYSFCMVPLAIYCLIQVSTWAINGNAAFSKAASDFPVMELAAARPFPPEGVMPYMWWVIIAYMFYVMAISCDDYLMPAVDRMIHVFNIPDDVAGATLVAFACNGPELLTNTCAIFSASGSGIGVGTVVGSAIFNCMCITGVCPIFAPKGYLDVEWKTFARDIIFSAISIAFIYWIIPIFDLKRVSLMFGMTFVYSYIVAMSKKWFTALGFTETDVGDTIHALEEKMLEHGADGEIHPVPTELERQTSAEARADWEIPIHWPKAQEGDSAGAQLMMWISFVIDTPTAVALWLTVADCKQDSKARMYLAGFFGSMVWLSIAAWIVCEGALSVQDSWGIPASFTGLTIVSIGTSWPNLWASLVMARAGRGRGAVANALGSNVQNVFFVLAFPIWTHVLVYGTYICDASDVIMSVSWMAMTVVVCWTCCALNKFRLTTPMGYFFISIYVVYILHAAYYEAAN